MEKINDGGPAYPASWNPDQGMMIEPGMTLRDYFAAASLPALINKLNFSGGYREECKGDSVFISDAAYLIADAMIKSREVQS